MIRGILFGFCCVAGAGKYWSLLDKMLLVLPLKHVTRISTFPLLTCCIVERYDVRQAIFGTVDVSQVSVNQENVKSRLSKNVFVESLRKAGLQALRTFSNFPPFFGHIFSVVFVINTNKKGRDF
jgi:hypothetical protein